MVAKISIGSSLYGALSYNGEKMNKEQGRVLGANKIILPADGQIDIARMVENFNAFMPKTGKTKKPVLHISLNPHPDDRLTEQQYEIIAREYLEKLGFGEQQHKITHRHPNRGGTNPRQRVRALHRTFPHPAHIEDYEQNEVGYKTTGEDEQVLRFKPLVFHRSAYALVNRIFHLWHGLEEERAQDCGRDHKKDTRAEPRCGHRDF
jgi:hypothetical protein